MNAPTKSARYNIDSCALLVEFNASQWTARKLDKSTTEEVVRGKGAGDKGAARVNKNLLAGRKELEVINQHVGAVRTYMYDNTLPWSDSGIRLLPSINFMQFNDKMQEYETVFNNLVDEFIDVYPTLITAQAMALGDMFKRDEFPSPHELKHKFNFRLNFMPVPSAGDFRVDVGNDAQKELQDKLSKLADERVEHAMRDVKTRLKEHLDRMSDRLSVDVVGQEIVTRKFHDSLLETAHDLCEMVKVLNVVNDQSLETARRSLASLINGVDVKDLRKDMAARTEVKTRVDEIRNAWAF
jgi:hypothetical protein